MENFIDEQFDMTSKKEPDSKRGRSELSSASEPEMAELTSADRAVLNAMHAQLEQLKKLDLLHEMSKDINDLKRSVDFTNKLIEELKEENATLKLTVNALQTDVEKLSIENKRMKSDMLDLQCRSMRNNVIIMGLQEEESEDYTATENIVKAFMRNDLKMSEDQLLKAAIERAHRLGRKKDRGRPRPVVVRFQNNKSKMDVMDRGNKLKGSHYSMFEQFPAEIVERRRLLVPIMKEHKARKIKARLVVDKLYINDELYRNPEVTTWM